MEIIGLSGYARSGKDEAAKVLVEEFGFTRVAFADKLRDFLYALNPMVIHAQEINPKDGSHKKDIKYVQDVIDEYGWDKYKETIFGDEIRRLLQRLGTEAGRETMWDSIWIDAAFAGLSDDAKVVVSDARFINEFEAVVSRGGFILRIERAGVGPANSHASELEALSYTFPVMIHNDGTLEEYRDKVRQAYLGLDKK
jgi:ectoine hydroxylase-related dioxygenase (phytanoyl-CoA dioxygenase family)